MTTGHFGATGADAAADVARNLPADTGRIDAKGKPAIVEAKEQQRAAAKEKA